MAQFGAFDGGSGADAFTRFWADTMSRMMACGAIPQPAATPTEEGLKQMRQAFFDAWASHCEEMMRSEQFLQMMRRSMDNALAFREQLNEFMTRALHENQMPARSDTDSILLVLRSLEERVLDRIEQLSRRVSNIEARDGRDVAPTGSPTAQPAGEPKRRGKETVR